MPQKILIIIPCFNEEKSIASLLHDFFEIDSFKNHQISIAVVNDGSTDKTAEIVSQFGVIFLNLPINLGIGGAMQTGFMYASQNDYDLAVQMDGDGQHPPSELHKLLKVHQLTNANVVIGSRFLNKEGFQSSALRRLGIFYLHWLSRLLTQHNIYDITSGFRLFDRKAIALAAENYPDEYPEPESLVIFAKAGFSIVETPVIMKPRQNGHSSIRYFSQVYYLIKVSIAMFYSFIRK